MAVLERDVVDRTARRRAPGQRQRRQRHRRRARRGIGGADGLLGERSRRRGHLREARGGGQLRRRRARGVDRRHHVRAALRGEGVIERGVRVHDEREAEDRGGGGDDQHQRDDDRLDPPPAADPAAHGAGHRARAHRQRLGRAGHRERITGPPGDPAVEQVDGAVGVARRQLGVVGDHHERLPGAVELEQQLADLLPGGGVERPGRLVGQQHRRPVDQGPRDRHPLALAAGEPARIGVPVALDVQRREQLAHARPCLRPGHPGQLRRQQDVVGDGQVVEQVEELEDHPDLAPAAAGHPGLAEPVDPLAGHGDRAARRPVQTGDQVQEGRLPAAGRAHHGHRLTRRDLECYPVDGGLSRAVVALRHVVDLH